MMTWGQSAFLQALGWATLCSLAQMAFLWICFRMTVFLFQPTAAKRFQLASGSLILGFLWFAATFMKGLCQPVQTGQTGGILSGLGSTARIAVFPAFLSAASITYLTLLLIPALRTSYSWYTASALKTRGLEAAGNEYLQLLQNAVQRLHIKKPVGIFLSRLVKAPVLIGFLKPVILLPVACISQLTPAQVEAILLHELEHIRRKDFLLNLVFHIIHTLLYFNPFVRLLLRSAEVDRELCCDEMVIRSGYNRAAYASALLILEKNSAPLPAFALAATGKSHLLTRIEKIAGIDAPQPKGASFRKGLLLASTLLCLGLPAALNRKGKTLPPTVAKTATPAPSFPQTKPAATPAKQKELAAVTPTKRPAHKTSLAIGALKRKNAGSIPPTHTTLPATEVVLSAPAPDPAIVQVKADGSNPALSLEQQAQVKSTIEAIKNLLATVQWKEVEKTIADGLTGEEKEQVHRQYLQELDGVDWSKLESQLQMQYQQIDWSKVNTLLKAAEAKAQLDNLEAFYTQLLAGMESAEKEGKQLPEVAKFKETIENNLKLIREWKDGETIRL